ncbi:MAG: hypothetical protein QOG77_2165 [Solirubrobacteraceae bacterium]|nr:hypothetical protein [Solirubrobacteraceae bacterium]
MSIIVYLVVLLLTGLVVGAFSRLALPGKDPLSIPATIAVGVGGSLLAGVITYAIWGEGTGPGLLLSIVCGALIMYLVRRSRGGGLMNPGTPRDRR